ncbi:hypothetical protein ACG33_04520 [Steroidobacter denitrificans]|uniref:Uncharacterized protein n=1 Tax=Steroidobacter denitrificans TaxID=465721 RepID=A0A127F7F3_STEDE|nr:hypothetical protein [Steroidobacter denitrificans]AMN46382.1 hypothetical protein ACG33_04520 [Steroidobacter denitrificans]
MRPSAADIDALKPDDLPALLSAALAGPADMTVIGDITADRAIAAMQSIKPACVRNVAASSLSV